MSWLDVHHRGGHRTPFGIFGRIAGISRPNLPVPARMRRVALVAAADAQRDVLARVSELAGLSDPRSGGGTCWSSWPT
jgi:hypothetical protein